ncbi:MAG TPA: hypothetical protein VFL04_00920, partial [Rectinemataceae bacterium]|nr:hypothetical protein [Rectinemataceae bacterium]
MDYLQTLEYQMLSLQRKLRLLQELRFFVESSTADELGAFAAELRSVTTVGGISVGEALASALASTSVSAAS